MFEVSAAKREVLKRLAERDWSPTDLADELGTSTETVYNHLNELAKQGVLTTRRVPAKTRPKTEYSIGDGVIQYLTVLPGQFREGSLRVTDTKAVMFRIWALPQAEFHEYLERYWWSMLLDIDIEFPADISAVGVFGSVARGDADEDSDIDLLVVTPDERSKALVTDAMGSTVLEMDGHRKLGMTEVYTDAEFRESLAHGSDFLYSILDELHPLYDPQRVLQAPAVNAP